MPVDRAVFLGYGEWTPDQPDYRPGREPGLAFIQNARPLSNGYYAPMPDLLSSDGANSMSASSGAAFVSPTFVSGVHGRRGSTPFVDTYVGTIGETRRLFHYDESAKVWTDASRASGYDGAFGSTSPWHFTDWGDRTVAIGGFLPPQMTVSGNDKLFADIGGSPPLAGGGAVVRNFLVLIGTKHGSFSGLTDTNWQRMWWSAIENIEDWPEPRSTEAQTKQSDFQMFQEGGRLQRLVPGVGGSDACLWAERKIWRMNYQGPPVIFRFDIAEADQGTASPLSVVPVNELAFFLGIDGFYVFDGATSHGIDKGRVYEFFRERCTNGSPPSSANLIVGGADTSRNLVYWSYQSSDATDAFNNELLIYNYASQRWGHATVSVDAMNRVPSDVEAIDKPRLLAVGRNYKASTFSGANLETILEPTEIAPADGQRIYCDRMRPVTDSADARMQLKTRESIWETAAATTERVLERNGTIPARARGRYIRGRLRIPAGSSWTEATGIEYYMRTVGPQRAGLASLVDLVDETGDVIVDETGAAIRVRA